ncbi:MAG: VOC family protein [Rhodovarius sp.]|nr:VOC family protein [Rhodovarius sp.]MCX7931109.1 VOC family protein [Rhodovarius sp.]MDW8313865.1 VOC family protein [Rhodovarius sp.]
MSIQRLDHFSIRTADLAATEKFYTEALGLTVGPRPNFPFPGVWLYHNGIAVVHVVGVDPNDSSGLIGYLGERSGAEAEGTGRIDHIAFLCSDIEGMRQRFRDSGIPFRERRVPGMALDQIFLEDPNGVTIELNFPAH